MTLEQLPRAAAAARWWWDDDADMRQRLRCRAWSGAAGRCSEAGDGAEALEPGRARRRRDLVLLDLTMPVMDGFSFLHRLRQMPGCADIPVIVLSARDITREERDRLDGADRILKKGETSMRDLTAELRKLDEKLERGETST